MKKIEPTKQFKIMDIKNIKDIHSNQPRLQKKIKNKLKTKQAR